jgi:hypothetical protein
MGGHEQSPTSPPSAPEVPGRSSKGRRGLLILGWFGLLLIANLTMRWSQSIDKGVLYAFLDAVICAVMMQRKRERTAEMKVTDDRSNAAP